MTRYAGGAMVASKMTDNPGAADVAKGFARQSVMPTLARVKPNRSARRVVTGKGLYAIPASQISRGGVKGLKQLKGAGEEAAQAAWKKTLPVAKASPLSLLPALKDSAKSSKFARGLKQGIGVSRGVTTAAEATRATSVAGVSGGATAGRAGQFIGQYRKPIAALGVIGGGSYALNKRDAYELTGERSYKVIDQDKVSAGKKGDLVAARRGYDTTGRRQAVGAMAAGTGSALASAAWADGVKHAGKATAAGALTTAALAHRSKSHQGLVMHNYDSHKTYVVPRGKRFKMDGQPTTTAKRHYDPENSRKFREGTATGVLGVGGAGALAYGGRGIANETRSVRDGVQAVPMPRNAPAPRKAKMQTRGPDGKMRGLTDAEKAAEAARVAHEQQNFHAVGQAQHALHRMRGASSTLYSVKGRHAGAVGAGAAALLGAGKLARHRHDERWD